MVVLAANAGKTHQGHRKHLKLGGARHLEGTFFLRKRGHFLKIKRAHFFVYCKILGGGGHVPPVHSGSYVYETHFTQDAFSME